MPIRRIIAYWLLILLPSFAIGGLALHYVSHENDLLAAQQRASLSDQGRRAAEDILLLVDNLQNGMVLTLESLPAHERVDSLRKLQQINPLVRAAFLFDVGSDRVVLPDAIDLTSGESQDLLRRYDALFSGRVPWFSSESFPRDDFPSPLLPSARDMVSLHSNAPAAPPPAAVAEVQEIQELLPQEQAIQLDGVEPLAEGSQQEPLASSKTVDWRNSAKGSLFRQIWNAPGTQGRGNQQNVQEKLGDKGSLYYDIAGKHSESRDGADKADPPSATPEGKTKASPTDAPLGPDSQWAENETLEGNRRDNLTAPMGNAASAGSSPGAVEIQPSSASEATNRASKRMGETTGEATLALRAPAPSRPVLPAPSVAGAKQAPGPAEERLSERLAPLEVPSNELGGDKLVEPGVARLVNSLADGKKEWVVPGEPAFGRDADPAEGVPHDSVQEVGKAIPLVPLRNGWKPWHWENSFYVLGFVHDAARGSVFGVELELLALLARLPAALDGGSTAAYLLRDQQGTTYFQSRLINARENPADVFNLGPALPFYELAVYPADPGDAARLGRFSFLAMALLVGVFLVAIASGGGLLIMQARSSWRDAMQKTSFVSNVSHELKTPLTTLRMYTEMLRGGKLAPEKQRHYLDVMLTEGERLSRLVGNVLDFSRLEQGRKKYQLEPTDLNALVGALVESSRVTFERPDLCVTHVPSDRPLMSLTDADAVEQILLNLLDNAAKYGAAGGEIRVTLGRGPMGIRITVLDRGPGIPESHREKIFDKFHRVDESLSSAQGGCGLGLSIARRLARDLGGELAHEERPGGGASFHLDLPASKEVPP